jgi:hypothetical protein
VWVLQLSCGEADLVLNFLSAALVAVYL